MPERWITGRDVILLAGACAASSLFFYALWWLGVPLGARVVLGPLVGFLIGLEVGKAVRRRARPSD